MVDCGDDRVGVAATRRVGRSMLLASGVSKCTDRRRERAQGEGEGSVERMESGGSFGSRNRAS
eukprot:5080666-Prymnesium_polylepis.1